MKYTAINLQHNPSRKVNKDHPTGNMRDPIWIYMFKQNNNNRSQTTAYNNSKWNLMKLKQYIKKEKNRPEISYSLKKWKDTLPNKHPQMPKHDAHEVK